MDELNAMSTPSVYHSAQESTESSSPDTFRTPFSTWRNGELDAIVPRTAIPTTSSVLQTLLEARSRTPSPSSSPLLERYIQSFVAPRTETTSPAPPIQISVPMPPRERKRTSRCSSIVSSPTRTMSSSTIQADVPVSATLGIGSPMIKENMLRDVSLDSTSYASLLDKAVDDVVRSLMRRGRTKEGHGLRELYIQSYNDPGSAQLLDNLLRQKADERQKWDFARYVQDVNRLSCQPPVVVIPPKSTAPMERSMPIRCAREDRVGGSNTSTKSLSNNNGPPSPRVVIEVSTHRPGINFPLPSPLVDDAEHSLESPNKDVSVQIVDRSWRSQNECTRPGFVTIPQSLTGIPEEHEDAPLMGMIENAIIEQQCPGAGQELKETIPARQEIGQATTTNNYNQLVSRELLSAQILRARRRKKTRNKMFLGANGPVYSVNTLFAPRTKHERILRA